MNQSRQQYKEIKLVGLKVRTNNHDELKNSEGKISKLVEKYWAEQIADKIVNPISPGVTYGVYTNYATDEHGDYDYFIGEQVESFENQSIPVLDCIIIPEQEYIKFTTQQGMIPDVIVETWQNIWQMNSNQLGGKRRYAADFEIYDSRAKDPSNAIVDIYIGIE